MSYKVTIDLQVAGLARRVHDNSDLTCLDVHLYFRSPVEQLTGAAINKLQAYQLSEDQWNLAETLSAILEVTVLYCFEQKIDLVFFRCLMGQQNCFHSLRFPLLQRFYQC